MTDKKTYIVDIDGTICTHVLDGKYENAKPIQTRIGRINQLFFEGHKIIYWTSRGMGRFNNDAHKANEVFFDLTYKQLVEWGARFTILKLGKPSYDCWLDDKATNSEVFFEENK